MKKIISIVMVLLIIMNMSMVFAEDYYVQVGAFESEAKAVKYTNYLNDIGYTAVMIPVYDLYKVFLGPLETEEAARAVLKTYKSSGQDAFFVIGSQMYYQRPVLEEVEEQVTEEPVEETSDEETVEEVVETESEDVEEEAVEETAEETDDETTSTDSEEEHVELEVVEPIDVDETIVTRVVEQPGSEEADYKLFTITLIVVLWLLFIAVVVVVRLRQSKNG
ncbi:SPOR domain-containing protein [Acidaminobacter sp. JC074]|uniref:SPOR domain-containing protein n=1 Tax=Acidaminobacter sp. JC074 TaxID=2530199 RepID=UPI001F0E977D|nr:SPOR domain-containing protein [Acidaminobacter sp. JC074]MCH4886810.1 SPOR domain-containing protein [Acidaminobacter sp. JC074]